MKNINGYWVDENNNRWDADLYTEEQAAKLSQTMIDCKYCKNCLDCNGCTNCLDCKCCTNCLDCKSCKSCKEYDSPPMTYITGTIGTRKDQTIFYYGDTKSGKSLQVICGCFRGNLEEFAQAVEKTHGDNEYGKQYKKEIEKVKILFELEVEQ